MDADGGMSKYSTNTAGAKYGTGYCDSQCPRDLKFINGQVRAKSNTTNTPVPANTSRLNTGQRRGLEAGLE